MPTHDRAVPERIGYVNAWVMTELARLNREILARRRPAGDLAAELARSVLTSLPHPGSVSARQAQQLVVLLGLAGASVSRHYQEADRSHIAAPERAFDRCPVGTEKAPFLGYFAALADRTGTGHCARDTYVALTRWNVPTTEIWWEGARIAALAGVFSDGLVRTYTGTGDEQRFFELIKISEAIELAINTLLMPISEAALNVRSPEALDRVRLATVLLAEVRRLNSDFAGLPQEESLRADYFMDVFRQYAVHWTLGDIPPSGALDPEAIARDLLLGVTTPAYDAHTYKIFPAMLSSERELLSRLMDRPSVPETVLQSLGLDTLALNRMSIAQLRETVGRYPVLAALYRLLSAHARMSGVHLRIAKKYLFAPQRQRELEGLGNPGVVSNRLGTTGMDELYLEELTHTRHQHMLSCLRPIGAAELDSLAGLDRVPAAPADPRELIRFTGPGTDQHNLAEWMIKPRHTREHRNAQIGAG
jgi:hypothetical protein